MSVKKLQTALFSAVLAGGAAVLAQPVQAAPNGHIMSCIGTNNCGMAGAGLAIAQDATSAALNPALGGRLGNETMVSMGFMNADIAAHIEGTDDNPVFNGNPGQKNSGADDLESGAEWFLNASMGVNYRLNDKFAVNLTFYPGGGGATDYDRPRTGALVNGGAADGNDHQIRWRMFNLQPSISWAPTKNQSYGLGITLVRADMKSDTLDGSFGRVGDIGPGHPGVVDVAYGVGFNIGGVWDLTDQLTLALDYQSRVWMERFKSYTSAFSSTIDRPPVFSSGLDFKILPSTSIALDYKFIYNENIATLANQPGDAVGGFGWKNIHVVALGVQHALNPALTVRAGWNYGNSPIGDKYVFANVLLPAIVEHRFTAGASMKFSNSLEFGFSAFITPMTKRVDSGDGDSFSSNNKDTVLKAQMYGAQLSVNYNF
jgi:long-chain fatty acid transport protein